MDRLELLERLAASTGGLTPTRGVSSDELVELRQLLAADLRASAAIAAPARSSMSAAIAHDRVALDNIAVDTRAELERAVDASAPIIDSDDVAPAATRVARRTLPFFSSAEPGSLAEWAAGRKVERTLGPFVDRDGRLVWFDIFAIVRQVSLVRAPSSTPLLTLPLRGFSLGTATSYELPAGSVWILSRALSAAAPAGAYSGVRIKKGRLRLSSSPTIAGLTLTIPNGARVTLELELDPPASTAPAATPGQDAHASRVKVPETATFVFTAAGGVLRAAGDASLKVFGAAFALQRKCPPQQLTKRRSIASSSHLTVSRSISRSRRAGRSCSKWRARRRSRSARGRFQLRWSNPASSVTRQALVRSCSVRKRDSTLPGAGSRPTPAAQSLWDRRLCSPKQIVSSSSRPTPRELPPRSRCVCGRFRTLGTRRSASVLSACACALNRSRASSMRFS